MVRDDNPAFIRSENPTGRFSSLKLDETYFYHFFIWFILLGRPNAASTGQMKLPCGTVCNERTAVTKLNKWPCYWAHHSTPARQAKECGESVARGPPLETPARRWRPLFLPFQQTASLQASPLFTLTQVCVFTRRCQLNWKIIWILSTLGPLVASILGYFSLECSNFKLITPLNSISRINCVEFW